MTDSLPRVFSLAEVDGDCEFITDDRTLLEAQKQDAESRSLIKILKFNYVRRPRDVSLNIWSFKRHLLIQKFCCM